MPVYNWKGLGTSGQRQQGKLFARSMSDLEKNLLKNEIGLIHAWPASATFIKIDEKIQFLSHLHTLLAAHIPLHKALTIMAVSAKKHIKTLIIECAALIAQGMPLSEALAIHGLSDEITDSLVTVGEKTGKLTETLKELVDHMVAVQDFKDKMRAATRGPMITFILFLVVLGGIFIGVIPRFESFFSADLRSLPLLTRVLLGISSFLRSRNMVYGLSVGLIVGYFLRQLLQGDMGLIQKLGLKISVFRTLVQFRFYTSLSVLLKNGVPLLHALHIIEGTLHTDFLRKELANVIAQVESGKPLSSAVHYSVYSSADIYQFLSIGESSNSMVVMLYHSAHMSKQRLYATLQYLTILIQPLLLILLGLLIAGLMYALYMPLLSMSTIIR